MCLLLLKFKEEAGTLNFCHILATSTLKNSKNILLQILPFSQPKMEIYALLKFF